MKPAPFAFKHTVFSQAAFVCAELPPIKRPCPESSALACPYPPGEDDTTARVLEPRRVKARHSPRERGTESVQGLIEDARIAPGGVIKLRFGRINIEARFDRDSGDTAFYINRWPIDAEDCGRYLERIHAGVPVKAP